MTKQNAIDGGAINEHGAWFVVLWDVGRFPRVYSTVEGLAEAFFAQPDKDYVEEASGWARQWGPTAKIGDCECAWHATLIFVVDPRLGLEGIDGDVEDYELYEQLTGEVL